MTRGNNAHVYTGKYALVGADGTSACRMSVRAHVQLPYGDLDRWSMPIGPDKAIARNRRTQARIAAEKADSAQLKAQEHITMRRSGTLSRKIAWSVILVTIAFFSILLLQQFGKVAQKENVLATLQAQIKTQGEANISLQEELNAAADEVKVRYAAVQELGMVAPKGIQTIGLVIPEEMLEEQRTETKEIPESSGFLASLFAFLD